MRNGTPLSLMDCLARVIRRVIVSTDTKNARAISSVVSPPTARSVSAICDAGASDGWQHMKSSGNVSSPSIVGSPLPDATTDAATASSRRRRACSARSRSVRRREATVINQAFGLSGYPFAGQAVAAARSASCVASSARSK